MKKKVFALVLSSMLVMSMAACSDKAEETTAATTEATTEAATEASEEAEATEATEEETEATEAETEETTEETTEAALDGEIDVYEGAVTFEAPEGWTVESVNKTEAKVTKDDIKGSYVKVGFSTKTCTAEEWASKYDENYGGGNTIDQVTIGDHTFWHLCPVEGQEFLLLDGVEEGTVIKITTMKLTLEDVTPFVEILSINK